MLNHSPHFTIKWLKAVEFSFEGAEYTKRRLWRNLVVEFADLRKSGALEMITTNDAGDFIVLYKGDIEDRVLEAIRHRINEEEKPKCENG